MPLDHTRPEAGSLGLAVATLPATGRERLGSLVLNFGGPGAPGVETLAAHGQEFADLREEYDLVAFDPRGVGHSAPVSCGGSLEPDEPDASDTSGAPDGPDADDPAAQLAGLRAVAERCVRHSGPVLGYMGTVHVARDLDLLRRALGERKLHYLGFSYGTRIGVAYAAQFPRQTGRMALDGVDTIAEPLAEQALASAGGQQQALDNFLAWCARQDDCVYGNNTRSAKGKVAALVARLDRDPLPDGHGWYFTGQDAVAAIAVALYSKDNWPGLARGLRMAESYRDPGGLLDLVGGGEESPAPPEDGVPRDNGLAALAAVNCADDPDRGDAGTGPEALWRETLELEDAFRKASPVFGPAQLMTVLSCYGRPRGSDFLRRIDRPPGIPRMLLVGTRGDPATPYRWTEETARRLGPAAVILDYKGDGHTGYTASACVRGRVNAFLLDGELPHGTRSCPADG
ncbi:alpha/beta hydrolase [Streptomyces sp. NPDC048603]|uniref:alpha/beta hydrolase n=1 Tax=Streptomyces sp. NPDC048603 TaxID=3365577 RepID=UPI00370FAFC7